MNLSAKKSKMPKMPSGLGMASALILPVGFVPIAAAQSETFGSGANQFTMEFVEIGDPGNPGNTFTSSTVPSLGGVNEVFRIGRFEVSQNMMDAARNDPNRPLQNVGSGLFSGDQPAAGYSWFEAAAFVNWLNVDAGHQEAYNLSYDTTAGQWNLSLWGAADRATTGVPSGTNGFRHRDAVYFLPSEDEWYKAAYYDPAKDGTGGYWFYPTGSDTAPVAVSSGTSPGTAVYRQSFATGPADITDAGGLSPYGTMAQGGNVLEWTETAFDQVNDDPNEDRAPRKGGRWNDTSSLILGNAIRNIAAAPGNAGNTGFRVASIPEPSTFGLILMSGLGFLLRRRRK
jgi:formylglycine-generating enzyme required for sulfatase activity